MLYKQRNRIEGMFGHLKINRAVATRYAHLATARLLAQICPRRLASRHPSEPEDECGCYGALVRRRPRVER